MTYTTSRTGIAVATAGRSDQASRVLTASLRGASKGECGDVNRDVRLGAASKAFKRGAYTRAVCEHGNISSAMTLTGPHIDHDDVSVQLHSLFEAARSADESELACTLLRIRGLEDAAGWDPFVETQLLVGDLTALISAPLQGHTQIRLSLLLYSHLTEVGAVYDMLANLANVIAGERYSIDPFIPHYPRNRNGEVQFLSTPRKVGVLRAMLAQVDRADIADLLDWYFNPAVRNSFAHADYTLHGDRFRSRSEQFEVDGVLTTELPLQALVELVNRTLAFFEAFVTEYEQQRRSYTAHKRITGRLGGADERIPVELLADPHQGLYGLRSPPK